MKVLVCFGTRPEAIKMAPVVRALKEQKIEYSVCVTAQHREMLDQVLEFFEIIPDHDLDLMEPNQNLNILSSKIFKNFNEVLQKEAPDVVLVQGDTTTAFTIAMAAFNSGIQIGHVEAGLRTMDIYSPFPEEANRQLISRIASFNFTPTRQASLNLEKEMIHKDKVFYTGNTVIDALDYGKQLLNSGYKNGEINKLNSILLPGKRIILVTGHRRENFEEGLREICEALLEIGSKEDVQIVFPVHPNPRVRETVYRKLNSSRNILLVEPLNYPAMLWLMDKCEFIISDSGGVQEEAPSFGKMVLVTRAKTERTEGVENGYCILTGASKKNLIKECSKILNHKIRIPGSTVNPYGDGKASERILEVLKNTFTQD